MKFTLRITLFLLLAVVMIACEEQPEEVEYRILSPTPRAQIETTPVQTVVSQDLTREVATDMPVPPTETPTEAPTDTPEPTDTSEPTETTQPTETLEPTDAVVETETLEATATVEPTDTDVPATEESTEDDATAEPTEESSAPEAQPTSINAELRAQQSDGFFLLQLQLDETCFLTDNEITGRLVARNFAQDTIYFYTRGVILFSINNSPLAPDFSPPEPTLRSDFVLLATEESYTWDIEDLGLFIQGMGPESGIDFGSTIFGLPPGEYWVTAAYKNDKDGLTEQIDGTYIIPEAAWQGTAVSREVRFTVVEDLADCPA